MGGGTAAKVLPACYGYVMPSLSYYYHTTNMYLQSQQIYCGNKLKEMIAGVYQEE